MTGRYLWPHHRAQLGVERRC